MAIPFLVLSVLGAVVFFGASDNPVGALFVGLAAVYVCEFFASLRSPRVRSAVWERLLGATHIAVGLWLLCPDDRGRAQLLARLRPPALTRRL
jgi:hypothetical protein